MNDFSSRRPAQQTPRPSRELDDLPTRLLDASKVVDPPLTAAAQLPDIGSLPTSRLTLPPKHPTGGASVPARMYTAPPSRQFPGADEYEREAQHLHEQAQGIEQRMWQLSEQLRSAHAHYQQLRGMGSPTAPQQPGRASELLRVGHDMAALVRQIDCARTEYIAIMKQAQRYLDIADQLRRGSGA